MRCGMVTRAAFYQPLLPLQTAEPAPPPKRRLPLWLLDEVAEIHWVNGKAPQTHTRTIMHMPTLVYRLHLSPTPPRCVHHLQEFPAQGLSHTHAPALQTPFRLQSMLFLHPLTCTVTTIATITTITIVERILKIVEILEIYFRAYSRCGVPARAPVYNS